MTATTADPKADEAAVSSAERVGRGKLLAGGLGALAAGVVAGVRPAEAATAGGATFDDTVFINTNQQSGIFITTNTGSPLRALTQNGFSAVAGHADKGLGGILSAGDPEEVDFGDVPTGTGLAGFGPRTGVVGANLPFNLPVTQTVPNAGIYGYASRPAATAIVAQHQNPAGYALEVDGCAAFASAGRGTIRRGRRSATVRDPLVRRNSLVNATLLGNPGPGITIQNVRPANGRFQIFLTRAAVSNTPFSYLAVQEKR